VKIYIQLSDQLNNWSDNYEETIDLTFIEKATSLAGSFVKVASVVSARLTYRALQEMWQARLQLRKLAGPWAQVLPIYQSIRWPTRDGLCASRSSDQGRKIVTKLATAQGSHRRDLQTQSRTSSPKRGVLDHHSSPQYFPNYFRHKHCRCCGGQYDSGLASGSALGIQRGGQPT